MATKRSWLKSLAAEEKAADSDKLDGLDSTAFLLAGGTAVSAVNADTVDGLHASAFLPVAGKAADANLLDGLNSTAFLLTTGVAADSSKLGGVAAASFQQKNTVVSLGTNWTLQESGTELLFRYGGVTKAKLTSAGTLTAVTDVGKGTM